MTINYNNFFINQDDFFINRKIATFNGSCDCDIYDCDDDDEDWEDEEWEDQYGKMGYLSSRCN